MQADTVGAGQTRVTEALLRGPREGQTADEPPTARRRTEEDTGGASASSASAPGTAAAAPEERRSLKRSAEIAADEASAKRTLSALASSISALGKGIVSPTSTYDSEFDSPPDTVVDVSFGWDFSKPHERQWIQDKLDREEPVLLIGMQSACTTTKASYMEGVSHLSFLVTLYEKQRKAGKFFLHENARKHTKSPGMIFWMEWNLREPQEKSDVLTCDAELCAVGATATTGLDATLVLHAKPVRWITNSRLLKESLGYVARITHVPRDSGTIMGRLVARHIHHVSSPPFWLQCDKSSC